MLAEARYACLASGPDSVNVAEVRFADTDTVLPCHLSRKSSAFQPGGSHGLKVTWPSTLWQQQLQARRLPPRSRDRSAVRVTDDGEWVTPGWVRYLSHRQVRISAWEKTYLSVNAVKTHLRSIYCKLSATHQSEAVRRAQQLQLL